MLLSFPRQVDLDELDQETLSAQAISPTADLIFSVAKLCMLRVYRSRKLDLGAQAEGMASQTSFESQRSTARATSLAPVEANNNAASQSQTSQLPTILGSLVPYLKYQAFLNKILYLVHQFKITVNALGLELDVKRFDDGKLGGMDWARLIGKGEQAREGLLQMYLEGRYVVLNRNFAISRSGPRH